MNKMFKLNIGLFLIFGCFPLSQSLYFKRNLIYTFEKLETTTNLKYVNATGFLSPDGLQMSFFMNFFTDLDCALKIQIRLFHFASGEYRKSFVDFAVELCQFFKRSNGNPLFQKLWKMSQKYGQIPTKCPIKKGLYSVVNYTADASFMPDVLPSNKFRLEVRAFCQDSNVTDDVLGLILYLFFKQK